MPRPTWEPRTAEQQKAVAAIDQAVQEAREAEYKLQTAIAAARALNVPVRVIVERTKAGQVARASRATLYRRRLGKKPDSEEGASNS